MSKFRQGTISYMIEELALENRSRQEAFTLLRPMVEAQIPPMVFKRNVKGIGRVPKSSGEQLIELKHSINRTYAKLDITGKELETQHSEIESTPEPIEVQPEEISEELQEEEEEELEEENDEEEFQPVAKGKLRIKDELQKFLIRVREIRKFCEDRGQLSETIDHISMRPALAASKLIPAGIPADALLFNMSMHWPDDVRRDAGILNFDFKALSRSIAIDRGIENLRIDGQSIHELFAYVLTLAEARQPIMLIGPAGTGKSKLAFQLARFLDLPYGETPMSPGASRGDLLGRHTVGGYIAAKFVEMYSAGGVFNFEELDSADPSMLIVLNNALAQDKLFNSMSGDEHEKSPNFIAISTANTFGLGANRDYTARERLDAATIDRWRMGRVFVDLDENVEEAILNA